MNKTKKLTQGAMMIAIIGALILLDRLLANWFDTIIVLLAPVVIIMYSAMYTPKDGLFVSLGILFVTFLFGNTDMIYMIFIPVGVVNAMAYSIAISKNASRRTVLLVSIISYVFGEIIATFVIYPILGISLISQITQMKEMLSQINTYASMLSQVGVSIDNILLIALVISTILTGVMEGVLIHLLAIFLLKRFKIKNLGNINIWEMKPNKLLSYACFISMFSLFLKQEMIGETLYYILVSITIIAAIILIYYGYIFLILYGRIVIKKNIAPLVVLLCFFFAPILFSLIFIGFLYGTGPLRTYLENKINNIQQ